jgi:hypothetical protein
MRPGVSDLDIAVIRVANILANSSGTSKSGSADRMGRQGAAARRRKAGVTTIIV